MHASDAQLERFRMALNIMADTISAVGQSDNRSFPLVRIPLYELTASHVRELSHVENIVWSPMVKPRQRQEWSSFVEAEELDSYEESKQLVQDDALALRDYDMNSTMRTMVWRGNRNIQGKFQEASRKQVTFPIAQCSPPPYSPTFFNYDMLSESYLVDMMDSLRATRSGLMSAWHSSLAEPPDSLAPIAYKVKFHEQFATAASNGGMDHPHSIFVQPVFGDVHDETSDMVGLLSSVIAWDVFFANLLPHGVSGITAVLTNTCGQAYTYALDGRKVRSC
jgi:hypothetical protein